MVDFGIEVNAVQKRSRDALLIILDLSGCTTTTVIRLAKITARAWIHSSDKHEISWIGNLLIGTRDGHLPVLKGLTKRFEDVSRKFGEFI